MINVPINKGEKRKDWSYMYHSDTFVQYHKKQVSHPELDPI